MSQPKPFAVDIIEHHHDELDPRRRIKYVGCQLFDDEESATKYAASCEDEDLKSSTHGVVRKGRYGDKEFA
jgi:hypothetical protein